MRGTRGITLIELVVAMAIFALVAVMGLQALTGTLRLRDGLDARAGGAADLARAVALLRHDLRAVAPMLFYPPDRAPPQAALARRGGGLEISLAGQPGLTGGDGVGFARAEWRLENGALVRRRWPTLTPARADLAGPPVAVLGDVRGLRLRAYVVGKGWVEGTGLGAAPLLAGAEAAGGDTDAGAGAAELYSTELPEAIELTLETGAHGPIVLVQSLK